jgi:hypothetical protein
MRRFLRPQPMRMTKRASRYFTAKPRANLEKWQRFCRQGVHLNITCRVIGSRRRDKARREAGSATGPLEPAPRGGTPRAVRLGHPFFLEESRLEQCADEDLGRMPDGGFKEGADNRAADATGVKGRRCRGPGFDGFEA